MSDKFENDVMYRSVEKGGWGHAHGTGIIMLELGWRRLEESTRTVSVINMGARRGIETVNTNIQV